MPKGGEIMEISREDFITIINYVFHGYMQDYKTNDESPPISPDEIVDGAAG